MGFASLLRRKKKIPKTIAGRFKNKEEAEKAKVKECAGRGPPQLFNSIGGVSMKQR